MKKVFNTTGYCDPELHYMVNLTDRMNQIKTMVENRDYFVISKGRQYGKTTLLTALAEYLQPDYKVISLDFQALSSADFETEPRFVAAFSRLILLEGNVLPAWASEELNRFAQGDNENVTLSMLFISLIRWLRESDKKVVLIIDEVDTASNNQVFLDFLAMLRFYYLKRKKYPVFQSVILAGLYDIRNIKRKIRPDKDHELNSP